jgi:3-dehydroquinate synthase
MLTITATHPTPYDIYIGENYTLTPKFINGINSITDKILLLTDTNVDKLYADQIIELSHNVKVFKYTISAGEQAKNRSTTTAIEEFMQQHEFYKDSLIIALGGGVITDIAGFVGATYMRGIKTIYIPTTLLAMVDASIGGKTGINTPYGKNQLGTITSPHSVFIDPRFLQSQPQRIWQDGWVETLKHGLLADQDLMLYLTKNYEKYMKYEINLADLSQLIYQSCTIKNNIVTQDPYENGIRSSLNIGHTVAHAIEAYFDYNVSHGHAVAIGIISESYLSYKLNIMTKSTYHNIYEYMRRLAPPIPKITDTNKFITKMGRDKKNKKNNIRMCLIKDIGNIYKDNSYTTSINDFNLIKTVEFINSEFTQT